MFSRVATLAGVVALGSAEQYRWQPNNDWSRASNWASGMGSGAVNLNVDCVNTFGSGAEIKLDQDMAVGSIDLPMNGELTFDGDIEITFDGNVGASSEWRCKSPEEMSSACPSNYVTTLANGTDVVPDTAPCSSDTILINADEAQSILWQPGQYVQMIQVRTAANGLESFGSEADFEAHWQSYESTRYIGAAPEINQPGIVATQCINTCPVHSFDNLTLTGEDRWSEAGQRALNQTIDRRDRIATARTELTALVGSVPMQDALDNWQDTYWTELVATGAVMDANTSFDSLPTMQVTLPPFTAGGEIMGEWMEQAAGAQQNDISAAAVAAINTIKYSTTKAVADNALTTLTNLGGTPTTRWGTMLGNPATAAAAVTRLNTGNADGSNNPVVESVAVAATPAQTLNTETVLAYAAFEISLAAPSTGGGEGGGGGGAPPSRVSSTVRFTDRDGWGKTTASSIDESQPFDFAPGGFKFEGVTAAMKVYTNAAGEKVPAVAPTVYKAMLSGSVAQITMFAEEQKLDDTIGRIQNLTTVAPMAASGDDADGSLMLIIIAAAAVLLLCIIIAVVAAGSSGGDNGNKEDPRSVVSFENPMYDEVQGDSGLGGGEAADDGLYDEPAFNNGGKQNPAFDDADDTGGGGYLDVEPDEDEDEDEDVDVDEDEDDE